MIAAQYEKTGNQLSANGWNGLVDATRRSMVGISDGMLMDQSPMGGTTLTQVRQMRPIRAKSESMFIPFALRAVNIGTVQHPNWKKIFYFPKFACDIIGGWAECDNEKFVGEQMWAKSGDWYYIADSTGNAGQAHIPAQEDVETVYLHVLKAVDGNEEIRSAIVTNSQLIPEDFNGYETDCICIGKFDCPTPQQIGAGLGPRVLEQYVSGQVQVYGDIFPLKLTVVNIGTDAEPEWVKAFWFSEGSVLYDGDVFANCHNKPYPGYTMGGEGLYFVANPEGSNTQVPLQEDVAYAFLHVKYTGDETEPCIAIVTNDDETIPAEFEGEEDYCCCIGRFTCPSAAQIGTGIAPAVDQQFISSQVHVGTASSGDRPFKIRRINVGTAESPSWKTAVYIPAGAVQHNSAITGATIVNDCTAITGLPGWYECPNDSTHQGVYLQMMTGDDSSQTEGRVSTVLHYRLYNSPVQTGGWPSESYAMTRYAVVALGTVDVTENTAVSYGIAPINVDDDYLDMKWYHDGHGGGGGGGDGDKVVIDDQRGDKTKPGVATFDHDATVDGQHRVYFSIFDTLGVDKVVFGTEEGQGLADYLAGDLEITTPLALGKNVNTENFADECLTATVDTQSGDEDKAANGKHTHKFGQLTDDEGNTLDDPETLITMFSNIGIIHDPEDPTGGGEILTINDVGDSASSLQKDGTASAGSAEAGLALLDHVHPLNIGTTETTYAAGNHGHGIIDVNGVIEDAYGQMVFTDEDGNICIAEELLVPEEYGLSDFEALAQFFSELEYDETSGIFKLPTTKLTFDSDSGHEGNCLLMVDENGEIHHSGNDMYDAASAVKDDYVAAEKSIPYLKKPSANGFLKWGGTSLSVVNFGTASGTIAEGNHEHSQYGTVKRVAGVDPTNGNVPAGSLVTALGGTTSTKLAFGNHKHASHTDIEDWGTATEDFLTDADLTDYAKKDDFPVDEQTGVPTEDNIFCHSHWTDDILVFSGTEEKRLNSFFTNTNLIDGAQVGGLTAGKWVKTDNQGKLTTPTEQPAEVDSGVDVGDLLTVNSNGKLVSSGLDVDTTSYFNSVPASGKWVKTAGTDGRLVVSDTDPITAATDKTGVIYNTNGTISYKPLNSANGIAGLNASSQLAIAQIPTGTTSSTVALGNHTHSQYGTVKQVAGVDPTNGNVPAGSLVTALGGTTSTKLAFGNHKHASHTDIEDWGTATEDFLTDDDLTDYAKNEDFDKDADDMFTEPLAQHAHWADGILVAKSGGEYRLNSFFSGVNIDGTKVGNLTANKVVMTDSSGKLSTSDTTVAKFSSAPAGSKWLKTSGTDGTIVESNDTPLVSDSTFTNDCLAAAVVSGNDKKVKSLSNPFTSSTQRQTLTYVRNGGDGTVIVRLDSYTIDKYGRVSAFTQGSTQFALLLG